MSFPIYKDDKPDVFHKREVFTCKTRDNYTLTMQRCFACGVDGVKIAPVYSHSIILVHGFASNRFTFDLNPKVSVPNYLADKGWDVWLIELRGSGLNNDACKIQGSMVGTHSGLDTRTPNASTRDGRGKQREHDWDFDAHVEDCRAIIEKVHSVTGKSVHVIGHSMGAMLIQCCAGGESGQRELIRSGVSIAGCVVMKSSDWTKFKWLFPIIQHFKTLHPEYLQKNVALASFRFHTPWDELFFHQKNVDTNVARMMFRKNWTSIPVSLIKQLRFCLEPGGIRKNDGSLYENTLPLIKVPMLCIAGSVDEQCHSICMEKLNNVIQCESHYRLIGQESGHKNDYGHFDLIVGTNAKTEVWDMVSRFLKKHDGVGQ